MGEVIYLTGAPAAGKSSVSRELARTVPGLLVFEYGQRLTDYIARKRGLDLIQEELREKSSLIVTPANVEELDLELVKFVEENRTSHHILIDSHPVTKEFYGFRITPFHISQFSRIKATQIWVLYTPPNVTIDRIQANSGGRPTPTAFEAEMHTALQASVAATYAIGAGGSVHLFDTSRPLPEITQMLADRLS